MRKFGGAVAGGEIVGGRYMFIQLRYWNCGVGASFVFVEFGNKGLDSFEGENIKNK